MAQCTSIDGRRVLELIRALDFVRVTGSSGEQRAFGRVTERLKGLGIHAGFEEFLAPWVQVGEAFFEVGGARVPMTVLVSPAFHSKWLSLPSTVDVQGLLVEEGTASVAATRVVVRSRCDTDHPSPPGAAAQVFACAPVEGFVAYLLATDRPCPSAYVDPDLRPFLSARIGEPCRFFWRGQERQKAFRNMIAEIPGNYRPDEIIVAGAHIDTWPGTVGASDDASGCAMLVEFARWFAAHPPERTVRLIWFTGEEPDRRGSLAYVRCHASEVPHIKLYVNLDSGVSVEHVEPALGISGPSNLRTATEGVLGELGEEMLTQDERSSSSDATAFRKAGIPTAFISARLATPPPHPHLPTDRHDKIDPARVERLGGTSLAIIDAAQAGKLPFG